MYCTQWQVLRNEIHVSERTSWVGVLTPKVDMPILVTLIIWTPTIQWFCGEMCIKSSQHHIAYHGHQKHTCLKEIGLCAQIC